MVSLGSAPELVPAAATRGRRRCGRGGGGARESRGRGIGEGEERGRRETGGLSFAWGWLSVRALRWESEEREVSDAIGFVARRESETVKTKIRL